MKIINPLYDIAFKYLMQEERFAKKVLSVILDTEIEAVSFEQQEAIYEDGSKLLRLFRLDFKATVRNADGSSSTVLIELQKSKFPTDIERFRNYLGMNYITPKDGNNLSEGEKHLISEPVIKYRGIYPIITIYILGYELSDLPYLAVTVNRDVIDSVSKKKITSKSFFIEHLTHQTHIIQVTRLPKERRTRLEQFLTLFNQAWCSEWDFILNLEDVPHEFEDIAQYLQEPVMDEQFRRNLELERQAEYAFYEQEYRIQREEKLRKEAENQAAQYLIEKEEAIQQKQQLLEKVYSLARMMKKSGIPIEVIIQETGLSGDEVDQL
jgi:predicted transposase/invertase (TIGR01784 family)